MKPFKDQPLARKAITLGMVPMLFALLLTTLVFVTLAFRVARENIVRDTDALVAIIAENVSAAVAFNDPATAADVVNALRAKDDVDAACVYDEQGLLFAGYARPSRACAAAAAMADQVPAASIVRTHAVVVGDRQVGLVRVTGNFDEAYARTGAQVLATVLALIVAGLIAWILARRMQHWVSHPVIELAATADRISASRDYAIRATKLTDDEVGHLVESFNAMLAEVQTQERLKNEFLAALSHELRTPLNAILGWLQILRKKNPEGAELARALERLERNAQSQSRVVEDLLDVSRIIAGKLQMRPERVDIRAAVGAAVDSVAPSAASRGVNIAFERSGGACVISADKSRLDQVFVNLLSNAVKFSRDGGAITVATRIGEHACEVTVHDDGVGIPADFLPHVFERFRQFDGSMTRAHGGLGLGLAIAKEIVDLHDGSIEARSAGVDCGATFIVRLPIRAPFVPHSDRPRNPEPATMTTPARSGAPSN